MDLRRSLHSSTLQAVAPARYKIIHENQPASLVGILRRHFCAWLIWLFPAIVIPAVLAQQSATLAPEFETKLKPGDIVYTDSGNAIEGGFVLKVDPQTGEETVISHGGYLNLPFGIVVQPNGQIILSEFARSLVQIDPDTGHQTLLADSTTIGSVIGIAHDPKHAGDLLIANYEDVIRFDLQTGQKRIILHGGRFFHPLYVAADLNGQIYALNVGWPKGSLAWELVRIDAHPKSHRVISRGGYFENPQGLLVLNGAIYVTDVATPDRNFGIGRIIRVDGATGEQTVVSQANYLVAPVGIAADENGQLIVADPYTINPESPDWYDGGIIRINPSTGQQTLIARGHGGVVNPCGLAIVSSSAPAFVRLPRENRLRFNLTKGATTGFMIQTSARKRSSG